MEKHEKKNKEAIEAVQLRIHSVNILNTCYVKGTVDGARDTAGDKKKSWPLTPEASEGTNKQGAWEKELQWFHSGREGGRRGEVLERRWARNI